MPAFSETLTVICTLGGQFKVTRNGDTRLGRRISVPAAKAGSVFSNDATDTVITLAQGHGITTDHKAGVFWAAGQRIDMTVSAVSSTTITVTNATGVGTAMPAAATACTVGVRVQETDVTFLATCMQMLLIAADEGSAPFQIGVNFADDADASLLHVATAGGEAYPWAANVGPANPITGIVSKMNCYNGSILAATEVVIGVLIT